MGSQSPPLRSRFSSLAAKFRNSNDRETSPPTMKASMRMEGKGFPIFFLFLFWCMAVSSVHAQSTADLQAARDRGDLAAIDRLITQANGAAGNSADGQYKVA